MVERTRVIGLTERDGMMAVVGGFSEYRVIYLEKLRRLIGSLGLFAYFFFARLMPHNRTFTCHLRTPVRLYGRGSFRRGKRLAIAGRFADEISRSAMDGVSGIFGK